MRARALTVVFVLALATTSAMAKDVYLAIGGSVNNFRTDARIFNPSTSKDIQIQAWYLPVGNVDNTPVQPVTITVPRRQMADYDDVVASLFHSSGTGGIRLSSADNFVATQRIYAQTATGTLGQFVPGLEASNAKNAGVLIQLKSNSAFRTNVGVVNPNNVTANVTWRLYDRNNALIATGAPIPMPPFAVIGPSNIAGTTFFNPGTADLSDAWVSYTSDQPVFAYASVIDNGTIDPTFIPMSEDTDPPVSTPPTAQTYDVTLRSFAIEVRPAIVGLNAGETITLHVHAVNSGHGFQLMDPDGNVLIADRSSAYPVGTGFDYTVIVGAGGTYTFSCTHETCGTGHSSMIGTFTVAGGDTGGPKY